MSGRLLSLNNSSLIEVLLVVLLLCAQFAVSSSLFKTHVMSGIGIVDSF